MTDQTPPTDPTPETPPVPPAPSGWVQPAAPPPMPPASDWVMPASAVQRGAVSGLSKLGALVLIIFGVLWALIGALFVVSGNFLKDTINLTQDYGELGNAVAGILFVFGIVILVIAIVEILVGVFAWRGSSLARILGILYGLLFGLGSLFVATGARQADATASGGPGIVLIVFAVGYLYVLAAFLLRWRQAA
jgi:hypothetical protein